VGSLRTLHQNTYYYARPSGVSYREQEDKHSLKWFSHGYKINYTISWSGSRELPTGCIYLTIGYKDEPFGPYAYNYIYAAKYLSKKSKFNRFRQTTALPLLTSWRRELRIIWQAEKMIPWTRVIEFPKMWKGSFSTISSSEVLKIVKTHPKELSLAFVVWSLGHDTEEDYGG
jgi:hypothetical protein